MPRPTMLKDPERQAILDCVSIGAPYKQAVMAAGVSQATFYGWMQQGRRDLKAKKETAFSKFVADIEAARARFITDGVAVIKKAADKGTWQAQAWLLERREQELFADNRSELRRMARQIDDLQKVISKLMESKDTPPAGQPDNG